MLGECGGRVNINISVDNASRPRDVRSRFVDQDEVEALATVRFARKATERRQSMHGRRETGQRHTARKKFKSFPQRAPWGTLLQRQLARSSRPTKVLGRKDCARNRKGRLRRVGHTRTWRPSQVRSQRPPKQPRWSYTLIWPSQASAPRRGRSPRAAQWSPLTPNGSNEGFPAGNQLR